MTTLFNRLLLFLSLALLSQAATALERLPYVLPSNDEKAASSCDTIFTMPDKQAAPSGGTNAIYDYFFKNIDQKAHPMETYLSPDMVLVKVLVASDGSVRGAKLLRAFNPEVGNIVLDLAKKMSLLPAQNKGRNVCSYRIIKLYFKQKK